MHNREILKFKKDEKACEDCGVCSAVIRYPSEGICIVCGAFIERVLQGRFLKPPKHHLRRLKLR